VTRIFTDSKEVVVRRAKLLDFWEFHKIEFTPLESLVIASSGH
jgi:hypothetical protein